MKGCKKMLGTDYFADGTAKNRYCGIKYEDEVILCCECQKQLEVKE